MEERIVEESGGEDSGGVEERIVEDSGGEDSGG